MYTISFLSSSTPRRRRTPVNLLINSKMAEPFLSYRSWGPSGWKFMHSVTLSYPDNPTPQDRAEMRKFFTSIAPVLPCPDCRTHFAKAVQTSFTETTLDNKENLFRWLVDVHNRVNRRLHKPILSYRHVSELYHHGDPQDTWNLAAAVVAASLMLFAFIKR